MQLDLKIASVSIMDTLEQLTLGFFKQKSIGKVWAFDPFAWVGSLHCTVTFIRSVS